MRLGILILEIMENILMIIGNLEEGERDIFQNGRQPYWLYDNMDQNDWIQCQIIIFWI